MVDQPPPPLGVDPKWMRAVRKLSLSQLKENSELYELNVERLSAYVRDGCLAPYDPSLEPPNPIIVTPAWAPWEAYLDSSLGGYRRIAQEEFEYRSFEVGVWEWDAAHRAVYAGRLATFIDLHAVTLFPTRFDGRTLDALRPLDIAYAALGVVIGAEEGWDIARACLAAYRQGWVFMPSGYAIYIFMFRLFCDYLGEPPLQLVGEAASEPYTRALFDVWQTEDLDLFSERCVAVLDFHTYRCRIGKMPPWHEFDNRAWVRCPIEILLLFKLRELNGLSNPEIDHPLTASVLGRLPSEGRWTVDPLLKSVHDRMRADGFEETTILAAAM